MTAPAVELHPILRELGNTNRNIRKEYHQYEGVIHEELLALGHALGTRATKEANRSLTAYHTTRWVGYIPTATQRVPLPLRITKSGKYSRDFIIDATSTPDVAAEDTRSTAAKGKAKWVSQSGFQNGTYFCECNNGEMEANVRTKREDKEIIGRF